MGYMSPMDIIHGIHVSHGCHPWDTCMTWMSSMGYMYPMSVHGIHVSHGYPWDIIPCNTMCTWPYWVKLGSVFWTSQEPSRGHCWVSIWGPRGFPGSIQILFGSSFGRSGNHPGTLQGVSRDPWETLRAPFGAGQKHKNQKH